MSSENLNLSSRRQLALEKRNNIIKDLKIDTIKINPNIPKKKKTYVKKPIEITRDTPYPFRHNTFIPDPPLIPISRSNSKVDSNKLDPINLDGEHKLVLRENDVTYDNFISILKSKSSKTTLVEDSIFDWLDCSYGFGIRKANLERILSICMCPSMKNIVIATGDKNGDLGFTSLDPNIIMDDYSDVMQCCSFHIHTEGINRIRNLYDSIYTCSYDGSMKKLYIDKEVTDDILLVNKDIRESVGIHDFINIDPANPVFYIALSNGTVCFLDERDSSTKRCKCIQLHEKKINTIDYSPVHNLLLTASLDRSMCLWDIRMMNKSKIKPLYTYRSTNSITSAYFSPSKQTILAASYDDTIKIFETNNLFISNKRKSYSSIPIKSMQNSSLYTSIKHNNDTGRYLTKFYPSFCPLTSQYPSIDTSDYFITGILQQPRAFDIYKYSKIQKNESYSIINRTFTHPDLSAIFPIFDVHPYYPVIAGGNSSGRVCVFVKHTN